MKEVEYYMFADKLIKEDKMKEYFSNCINVVKSYEKIALWGAARGGSAVVEFLQKNNINKEIFFVDNNPLKYNDLYCGKKVISANELIKMEHKNILVVITCADTESVKKQLNELNWKGKVEIFDFAWIDFENSYYEYIYNNLSELEKAYNILEDSRSRDVFTSVLNYKMTKDSKYTKNICEDYGKQYFDDKIIKLMEDEVFIDGGAYNGDTIKAFLEVSNKNYSKIIGFEPDYNNYRLLQEYVNKQHIQNVDTYNLGLYNESRKVYFNVLTNGGASSSFIDKNGSDSIRVDSIDNIMNGERVSFIKMDIEGSEAEAILGAKKTIKKYKPVLAICAYHKKEDFHKIPLLIKSINESYKIYFRHYSLTDFETVIYAI